MCSAFPLVIRQQAPCPTMVQGLAPKALLRSSQIPLHFLPGCPCLPRNLWQTTALALWQHTGKGRALRDICPFLPKEPQKDQTELQIQKQGFLSSSSDQKLFQKKTQSNSGSRLGKKGLYRHSYRCPLTLADKSCNLGFCQQLQGFQGCSKTSLPRFVGSLCLPLSNLLQVVIPIPSCWD